MLAANVLLQITWLYVLAVAAVAVGAFVARGLVVFGMLPVLEKVHLVQPVDNRYKAILVWGGLRGAVTIVLAMVAAGNDKLPEDTRRVHRAVGHVVRAVHAVRQRNDARPVHACAGPRQAVAPGACPARPRAGAVEDQRRRAIWRRSSVARNARIEGLAADPASAGEAEVEAVPAELALDLDERVKVGLVTLCTREKELYLEQFEQQILSRRMVAVLTARRRPADRQCARQGRRRATRSGWSTSRGPISAFASALWLHRRLGFERMLTERLADRFETLMVTAERAGRACRLQHQLGGRPAGQRRRGSARRGDRQSPGSGRQRLQGAVAAVSGLRRIDRDAPARARRHPLRIDGVQSPPARGHHQPRGLQRPARAARRAPWRHQQAAAARSRPGTGQDDRARAAVRLARPGGGGRARQAAARRGGAAGREDHPGRAARPIPCTSSPRAR